MGQANPLADQVELIMQQIGQISANLQGLSLKTDVLQEGQDKAATDALTTEKAVMEAQMVALTGALEQIKKENTQELAKRSAEAEALKAALAAEKTKNESEIAAYEATEEKASIFGDVFPVFDLVHRWCSKVPHDTKNN